MNPTRRDVLRLLLATAAAGCCGGCHEEEQEPLDTLPLGDPMQTRKVRGYRGLADLPYFELDGDGDLRLTVDDLPPPIDFHTHLAVNMFLAPHGDLLRREPRTHYLIDCDGAKPSCVLDLDVYINRIASKKMLDEMEWQVLGSLIWGSSAAATHTIPNLVAELDSLGFARAVLLPIASGLPIRGNVTRWWMDAVQQSGVADRLVMFGSVHPTSSGAAQELRELAKLGIRGVKLHPTMQRFRPDDPRAMPLYGVCEELGLPVFFHAGRAGIEPEFTRDNALMKNYVAPVADYPNVRFVFGHSGARDYADAIPIAREHRNVWMDVHGQGVPQLREILAAIGPERLVFGSDWPWYPVAATLAKVLIATEGDKRVRNMILSENATRFLST